MGQLGVWREEELLPGGRLCWIQGTRKEGNVKAITAVEVEGFGMEKIHELAWPQMEIVGRLRWVTQPHPAPHPLIVCWGMWGGPLSPPGEFRAVSPPQK